MSLLAKQMKVDVARFFLIISFLASSCAKCQLIGIQRMAKGKGKRPMLHVSLS